jgi:hypothetical protein
MGFSLSSITKEFKRATSRIGKELRRSTGDVLRSEIGSIATLGLGGELAEQIDPTAPILPPTPEAPDLQAEEVQAAVLRERQRARQGRRGNILTGASGAGLTGGGLAQSTLLG